MLEILNLITNFLEVDNGNVHRAAAKIIVSKSRAARGSVCNVLLFRVWCWWWEPVIVKCSAVSKYLAIDGIVLEQVNSSLQSITQLFDDIVCIREYNQHVFLVFQFGNQFSVVVVVAIVFVNKRSINNYGCVVRKIAKFGRGVEGEDRVMGPDECLGVFDEVGPPSNRH